MIEKVKTAAWFAQRPRFWPHMFALAKRKIDGSAPHELKLDAASAWAAERARPISETLAALGLNGADRAGLEPQVLIDGERRAARSQVAMGGPGDLDLIYRAILALKAQRMVETGVAYGWSSLAALAALRHTGGQLASVDMPYPKANNEAFVGIVVPDEWRENWTLFREPDRNGIKRAIASFGGQPLDVVHYDSDKSYPGRMYAYPLLWNALRSGGLFVSDDIQDNFGFRDFAAQMGLVPGVTESDGKFVGVLRKP